MLKIIHHRKSMPDRTIIFGRFPVPGKTKTRLIPELGIVGAADFQRRLTEKIFATVQAVAHLNRAMDVEFCFTDGSSAQMRRWLGRRPVLTPQVQGDLGKRMQTALAQAFHAGCRRVVLLGTDIPGLRVEHLNEAFHALRNHDLVLGPSKDGGYWLIGLKQPLNLFQDIQWDSPEVLEQTLSIAAQKGLKIHQLQPLMDMDSFEDIKAHASEWIRTSPYLSVVIPALNEEKNISTTIRNIRDRDAEIIVVDGGSTDHTVERASQAGARVVKSPKGRAIQLNAGAAEAKGVILLFLHADTLLPKDYVAQIFEALMNAKVVAGAFRFKTTLQHPLMKAIECMANLRSRFLHLPYGDQGLFIKKALLGELGGFPEVPIAEDLFMVRRINKRGRIGILPSYAVTSARRWQTLGLIRTTLINQIILAGCFLGISPAKLAPLYRVRS